MRASLPMSDGGSPQFATAPAQNGAGARLILLVAIVSLRKRLARAETERDGWQAAGNEEKYLSASYSVEALRLQLERLELAARAALIG
jgi:hypothetical protein